LAHVSALGAAQPKFLKPVSRYQRTKYRGEEAVREAAPEAVILRPAPVFGPDDTFLNRLAQLARFASFTFPMLPLVGGATKMQPVFAGDVARAIAAALDEPRAHGRTFELGGPHIYTMRQIFDYVRAETCRKPMLLPLPFLIAQPLGLITEWLYKLPLLGEPPITGDQVTSLQRDGVVDPGGSSFADLGITELESIETIAPSYLWRYRPYGQFQTNETA
jgi:NADH dehydrogenase